MGAQWEVQQLPTPSYPESGRAPQVEDAVLLKAALTSDTCYKCWGPQVTLSSEQLSASSPAPTLCSGAVSHQSGSQDSGRDCDDSFTGDVLGKIQEKVPNTELLSSFPAGIRPHAPPDANQGHPQATC